VKAANLDLHICIATSMLFICEGSFTCQHLLWHGTFVSKTISERDPWLSLQAISEWTIITIHVDLKMVDWISKSFTHKLKLMSPFINVQSAFKRVIFLHANFLHDSDLHVRTSNNCSKCFEFDEGEIITSEAFCVQTQGYIDRWGVNIKAKMYIPMKSGDNRTPVSVV
jgi:hypothetical protein